MTRKKIRLSDVAARAATSTKTASRVINGDPRVHPETRKRVEDAVEELGYQVDVLARSLRSGRDSVIGLVVESVADPFMAEVIGEVEHVAQQHGVTVMVASNGTAADNDRPIIEGLLHRRVAGIVITPQLGSYDYLRNSTTPIVFIDRAPKGVVRDLVIADDQVAARAGVEHLIARGHRRIGLISDSLEIGTARLRHAGYREALERAGVRYEAALVKTGCKNRAASAKATAELLAMDNPPTAIFSSRAEDSIGVVKTLHERKAAEVAMVSFGDFANAEILDPPVTVLDHSPVLLGRYAAERVFARMNGDDGPPVTTTITVGIVPRGSGELPPHVTAPSLIHNSEEGLKTG